MRKVLAVLAAVLLLTCLIGSTAMAAEAPWPSADPNGYAYGYSTTVVSTAGKTIVKDGDHIKLDKSDMEKPSNKEIENFLNSTYVADPPKFTVRCVAHDHWMTDEGDHWSCLKGWVKESNSHYTCDGGYWKVVDSSVGGKSNVVKAQWCCPYQKGGKHTITITITYKAPHTHTPGAWTTVKEATCTEKGKEEQKCTECGKTLDSKEIPVNPDKHPENAIELRDTCNTHDNDRCEGHQNYCTKCKSWVGNVEAHTYPANPYARQAATENEAGWEKYMCEKCDHVKIVILPKQGHTHRFTQHAAVEPSCTSSGSDAYQTCAACSGKYFDMQGNEVEWSAIFRRPLGHTYKGAEWQEDYNAFINGEAAHVMYCTRANCNDRSNSAKYEKCEGSVWNDGKDEWNDYKGDPNNHYMDCDTCGRCYRIEAHEFSNWTNVVYPTCTEPGEQQRWCRVCNYREKRPTDPQGHKLEVQFKRNPTCLNTGMETHYECAICGQLWRDALMQEPVEAKDLVIPDLGGHLYADNDWVTDGPVNHKHYCQRFQQAPVYWSLLSSAETYAWYDCGADKLEDTVQTEPHTWGEWHAVANTKNMEERQCTKCTEKQTRETGCDHMWTEIKREPTCLEEGYQADKCIKCGLIVREQVLPALGHDWGEWEVVTPATIEAEGLEKRVCKRDASHVETRTIAKLEPTPAPTEEPTVEPTAEPTVEPTAEPTAEPTVEPTKKPGKTDIPKTGDNSHFGYAYLMIAVAAAGLAVLAATRRKEGSK